MRERFYPDFKTFSSLARKGNLVPVYLELLADLETPVSSFLKICHSQYAYLLESVEDQEKIGRYSFLSSKPSLVFKSKGRSIEIAEFFGKKIKRTKFSAESTPLDEVKKILLKYVPVAVKGLPRFCGGFVGYVSYDMVRFFEKIPDKNKDDLKLPDCVLMLSDTLIIFDHIEHKIKIVANVFLPDKKNRAVIRSAYTKALRQLSGIKHELNRPLQTPILESVPTAPVKIDSNFSKKAFCGAVKKAKQYIRKGDIIQTVLSQRFQVRLKNSPMDIYRRLRSINPSPYMYFLKLGSLTIAGSSPEMLIRCEDGRLETRPIAGTRPRGRDEADDERLAKELLNDKKERAEHLMLVDLGRNDVGRVARKGTVEVKRFMAVEKYSHVMHLVSSVQAQLDRRFDAFGVLSCAFPAGTVSGAPKIRAMEIIDELENVRRGPYAGCVGYFSFSGNMDMCITIRTILIKDGICYVQAGAGLVADSVPEKEYKETQNKAKALIEAITAR